MLQQSPHRQVASQLFAWVAAAAVVCLPAMATPAARSAQEGVFVPSPHQSSTTRSGHLGLLNQRVRLTVASRREPIFGRLLGIDSAEVVVSVDGLSRTFPISDVKQIEAAPQKAKRTERWLTVAGLAGIVAAFLFGQVGG